MPPNYWLYRTPGRSVPVSTPRRLFLLADVKFLPVPNALRLDGMNSFAIEPTAECPSGTHSVPHPTLPFARGGLSNSFLPLRRGGQRRGGVRAGGHSAGRPTAKGFNPS